MRRHVERMQRVRGRSARGQCRRRRLSVNGVVASVAAVGCSATTRDNIYPVKRQSRPASIGGSRSRSPESIPAPHRREAAAEDPDLVGRVRAVAIMPRMKRRDFLTLAGLTTAAPAAAAATRVSPLGAGTITVEGHRAARTSHRRTSARLCRQVSTSRTVLRSEATIDGYALVFCTDQVNHRDYTARRRHLASGGHHACKMRLTGTW